MGLLAQLHGETQSPTARDYPQWRTWDEVADEGHGLVQLGLERMPCFGACPVYTAVIHSAGRVEYQGDWHVKRLGNHHGKASRYDFRCLAHFIQSSSFWDLEGSYDFKDCVVTDCASTYVMVATRERKKIVSNYGNAGPPILWAIAELIDSIIRGVTWDKECST